MRTAVNALAEIAKSEPKHLASQRPAITQALNILGEPPSKDRVSELQYLFDRIYAFCTPWRSGPRPEHGDLYIPPRWASSTDREVQEALRLLTDARGKMDATLPEQQQPGKDYVQVIAAFPNDQLSNGSTMKIFISHSSVDCNIASALVDLLKTALLLPAKDIRCTSVDGYKLSPGAKADDQLRQEVFQSDCFIALLSPSSLRSIYVMFEMGARWASQRPLLPILVGEVSTIDLKPPLSGIHATSGTSESDLHQIISTIAGSLGIASEEPSAYLKALKAFLDLAKPKSEPS